MHYFNVLVVDDEQDFLETLTNRLKRRKIDTAAAKSGEEALELMEDTPFDVVILDIKMPGGMDGIETLREIRKRQPHAEIILLTGHASVETSIEGMKLGAFDYLLKPVNLEELLEKVYQAIEKQDKNDKNAMQNKVKKSTKYW